MGSGAAGGCGCGCQGASPTPCAKRRTRQVSPPAWARPHLRCLAFVGAVGTTTGCTGTECTADNSMRPQLLAAVENFSCSGDIAIDIADEGKPPDICVIRVHVEPLPYANICGTGTTVTLDVEIPGGRVVRENAGFALDVDDGSTDIFHTGELCRGVRRTYVIRQRTGESSCTGELY